MADNMAKPSTRAISFSWFIEGRMLDSVGEAASVLQIPPILREQFKIASRFLFQNKKQTMCY
jgi:hypothetical protein